MLYFQNYFSYTLIVGFFILYLSGILFVFTLTPADALQGIIAKIMYLHVPSAWICLLIYSSMVLLSAAHIITNNNYLAQISFSLSSVGLFFNFFCILTGMIWAHSAWGVWWAWDARLTFMLVLLFFYTVSVILAKLQLESLKPLTIVSVVNLIGAINLPIIKFSVDMLNTVHQKSSVSIKGISIDPSMSYPLIFFTLAFIVFSIEASLMHFNLLITTKKTERMLLDM